MYAEPPESCHLRRRPSFAGLVVQLHRTAQPMVKQCLRNLPLLYAASQGCRKEEGNDTEPNQLSHAALDGSNIEVNMVAVRRHVVRLQAVSVCGTGLTRVRHILPDVRNSAARRRNIQNAAAQLQRITHALVCARPAQHVSAIFAPRPRGQEWIAVSTRWTVCMHAT